MSTKMLNPSKKNTHPNHNQQQQYRVNQNVPRDHHESKQRGRRVVLVRDKKASFVSIFHLRGCDNKDGLIYFFADHLFVVVLSSFSFLHSHFFSLLLGLVNVTQCAFLRNP